MFDRYIYLGFPATPRSNSNYNALASIKAHYASIPDNMATENDDSIGSIEEIQLKFSPEDIHDDDDENEAVCSGAKILKLNRQLKVHHATSFSHNDGSTSAPESECSTPVHGTPDHSTPNHSTPDHSTPDHSTPNHGTPDHRCTPEIAHVLVHEAPDFGTLSHKVYSSSPYAVSPQPEKRRKMLRVRNNLFSTNANLTDSE